MTRVQELVFGPFVLDPMHRQLWRAGQRVALQPQPLAVLHQLVLHAGRVVPSEDLLQHAWGSTHVSRTTLKVCIRAIRIALDDDSENPRYVETVGRQGYRFLVVGSAPSAQPDGTGERTVVGRAAALTQLEAWAARAQDGGRQLVFVTGEPGIGKTTVVDLFLDRVAATGPVAIGRGQCLEQSGEGEAYLPVLEALGHLCRAPGGFLVVDVLRKCAPTWLVQMPALIPDAEVEVLHRTVAGATRERMLREMAETLDVLAAEQPLVLVFEDLHWSDHSTVELLAYVAQRRSRARLLMLATYRPVDLVVREHPLLDLKHGLQSHGHCVELPLELLAEDDVAEYLSHRLGTGPVPEGWAQALHRRTDGNPLFMVTLLDDYLARGGQEGPGSPSDGEVVPDEGDVPPTLQETIARQVARRSTDARAVLEAASVAGMEFSVAAVAAGLALEPDPVETVCEELARESHFLCQAGVAEWPDGTVSGRFAFRHTLYRQVLYQQMAPARRVRLHRRIGDREEAGYGARTGEIAARLAVHFTAARDLERAVLYLSKAAGNAIRRSAYHEAVRQLADAVELLQKLPASPERAEQELVLQVSLASALMISRGVANPHILQPCERALELCAEVRESPRLVLQMTHLCALYQPRGDLRTAVDLAERALAIAGRVGSLSIQATAHCGLGTALMYAGGFCRSREHLEQVVRERMPRKVPSVQAAKTVAGLERLAIHDERAVASAFIAPALWFLGFPDQASMRIHEVIRGAGEIARPFSLGTVHAVATIIHIARHEVDEVSARAVALRAVAAEHGLPVFHHSGTILEGWVFVQQGKHQSGLAQIRKGLTAFEAAGPLMRPWYFGLMADALGKAGRVEEALDVIDRALAQVDRSGERWCEAELYRMRGEIALSSAHNIRPESRRKLGGRRYAPPTVASAAEACFSKAIETARAQSARSWELRALTSLARLLHRQDNQEKKEDARRALATVYDSFTEGFDTRDLREARALLAELG